MENITGSMDSSSELQAHSYNLIYIVITLIIATLGIILNSNEIHLIWRKWKKTTDFEVLLLHLGIADLLISIGILAWVSLEIVDYVNKASRPRGYSLVTMGIMGFFSVVSTKLVIVIGIERLLAIKLPLKHRLWHTSRKTTYRRISAVWVASFIVIGTSYLADYLIQKATGHRAIMSGNLAYGLAAYLTLGVCAILVTYSWLSKIVINRATKLLNFDNNDYKQSPKAIRKAIKKEKATIIICRLVAATFLVCNIPAIVALYRGKMDSVSVTLFNLNGVINPLIYFFKGYAEKQYAKKTLAVSSIDSGSSNDKLDRTSPKVIKLDTSLKMEEVNKANSSYRSKISDQEIGSSRDQGEEPVNKSESSNKAKNGNLSTMNYKETGRSENKDEERLTKLHSSAEMETVNVAGNGDLSVEIDQDSGSSKGKGERR